MEEEAHDILRVAVATQAREGGNLLDAVHRRLAKIDPVDLAIPARESMRQPPDFRS